MNTYKNLGGSSGIRAYKSTLNSIIIQFKNSSMYEYTLSSVGQRNLAIMKKLAIRGSGLNTFVNQNVRSLYSRRII